MPDQSDGQKLAPCRIACTERLHSADVVCEVHKRFPCMAHSGNIRSENICHNLLFISCRPHFDTSFFSFTINDGSWELDANFRHEKCVLLHFTLYFSCLFLLCYENRYFAFQGK